MTRLLGILAALALGAAGIQAQNGPSTRVARSGQGNDLFQKALSKERAEGQIAEAIKLYERVVIDFASDRALVAKALMQIGRCHERLGSAEAQKAYQRVVREYADQSAPAADARARLTALERVPGAQAGPSSRRVWAGAGVDLEGAPTADGRSLTFVDWETGDLAVRDLSSGAQRRLTKNPRPLDPGFANASVPSPDGRRVAFTWFNNAADAFELRIVGMDGNGEQVVYSRQFEYVLRVDWMPDGRAVAIALKRADGAHQLAIASLADGKLRPLRTFDWRAVARISVSPDGRYLAYDFPPREDSPNRDLYLLATDGSTGATLVEHGANDLLPLWTPDGRHVVFVSDRTGTPGLWTLPVTNGKAAGAPRMIQPIGNLLPLGFTRNGSLYYGLNNGGVDVYLAAFDPAAGRVTGEPRPAAPRILGSNSRPDWSFDGRFLAYQSERVPGGGMGARVLSVLSMDTGTARELSPAMNYFQRPRWSADGQTLLVTGNPPAGRHGIYAVDVDKGSVSPVALAGTLYGHSVSPDGTAVFFTTADDRGRFIAARHTGTGEVRELYRPPAGQVNDAAPSPDGRFVAFHLSSKVLAVMPLSGGVPRDIVHVPAPDAIAGFGGINWTRDGRHLLFVRQSGPRQETGELWRVPVEGGEAQKVGLRMRGLRDVRLHPGGRQLAFTAGDGSDEVWILENLSFAATPGASGTRGKR
jgi:Tol biopolymer transport system component